MTNAAPQIAVENVKKKIVFKHYRTGEELIKIVSEIPHLNTNPNNARVVYWNHTDDRFEDIAKKSIIKLENVEE